MQLFQPRWLVLCAISIITALIPQLLAQDGDPQKTDFYENPGPSFNTRTKTLRTFFERLRPNFLERTQIQPRSPWETPPTAYLPYPPPPNYVWPPGPHTQSPPPSETNAPGGWYGGTGTGGQGNSGAGSASNAGSTSFAAPRLRIPSLWALPSNLFLYLIPQREHRQAEHANRRLKLRDPVETPPTQFLPYPPPAGYQYPPGQNAGNQYPKPSEFDPPAGVFGSGSAGNNDPNVNANTDSSSSTISSNKGGGEGGWGQKHVAWVVIVAIFSTALVVGGLAWWYRGKRLRAPPKAVAVQGEKEKEGGGIVAIFRMLKGLFWEKDEKKEKGGASQPPPPAAAGGAGSGASASAGSGAGAAGGGRGLVRRPTDEENLDNDSDGSGHGN